MKVLLHTTCSSGSKSKYLMLGMFIAGGLIAAGVIHLLKKEKKVFPVFHGHTTGQALDITV